MKKIVYEVLIQENIIDCRSHGIFESGLEAIKEAKKIADEKEWKLLDGSQGSWIKTWGEVDDYGLLEGVFVAKRILNK